MIWNKRKKEIEKLKERLRISDKESQNKIEQLINQLSQRDDNILDNVITTNKFNNLIAIKDNQINKLTQDLKDIIKSESIKPEPKVEINYITTELKSITIKDECTFTEIKPENEIESINGLMIKLLPYIYSTQQTTTNSNIITYFKQITILTNK